MHHILVILESMHTYLFDYLGKSYFHPGDLRDVYTGNHLGEEWASYSSNSFH